MVYICGTHRTLTNGESVLNWLIPQVQWRGSKWNTQFFWERGLLGYLHSCGLIWLLIKPVYKDQPHTLQRLGRLAGSIFTLSLCSARSHWYLQEKRLYTGLTLQFLILLPKDTSLDSLVLVANGSCVYRFNGKTAKNQLLTGYHLRAQWRRVNRSIHSSLSLKEVHVHTLKDAEFLDSSQPESRSWLRYSVLRQWQVLAHPQLLEATMTKVLFLDITKLWETTISYGRGEQ